LHIVGGGSQNSMLNQFTANATGMHVIAGPVEATAIGNIIMQGIAKKAIGSLEIGRRNIMNSFELKYYEPMQKDRWEETYWKHRTLFE
jgi:rhamnulokinase